MPGVAIEQSIAALFALYRAHPLRLMREIGVQTRLAGFIQDRLAQPLCRARVVKGTRMAYASEDTVERTQMEICIETPNHRGTEASDIVVLQPSEPRSVSLKLYSNGHLDIVSKIAAHEVAAVIEVKAACSADLRERHKFRLDIAKLLSLARRMGPANKATSQLHFVLVDKSLSVRGHDRSSKRPKRDWFTETEADVAGWSLLGQENFWARSPRIRMLENEPAGVPFVHVWSLEQMPDGSAGMADVHRYAVDATI